jgi:hypothetical protein
MSGEMIADKWAISSRSSRCTANNGHARDGYGRFDHELAEAAWPFAVTETGKVLRADEAI